MKDIHYEMIDSPVVELMEAPYGFDMKNQHYHDTYEIFLLLEGERYVFFNDECHRLQAGDLFIVEPYVLHSTTNLSPTFLKRYLIHISPNLLLPILTDTEVEKLFKRFSTCIIRLDDSWKNRIYAFFDQVDMYSKRTDKRGAKLMHAAIFQLLDGIDTVLQEKISATTVSQNPKIQKNEILTAINYVNGHYAEPITLDFITEYVHMSKSNFCLAFRKVTGETFAQYLNKYRITKVHQLLVETNLPLSEIAAKQVLPRPHI